jgi:hypothetical protein
MQLFANVFIVSGDFSESHPPASVARIIPTLAIAPFDASPLTSSVPGVGRETPGGALTVARRPISAFGLV